MKQRQGYIITMLCASLLLTLCGCSDDSSDGMQQRMQELRLSLGYPAYRTTNGITRTDPVLPASFELYSHSSSLQPISQIQCYLTYEQEVESQMQQKYISCQFDSATIGSPSAHVWTSKVPLYTLPNNSKYRLYGFMPKENLFVQEDNNGATIAPYGGNFTNGAVITFTGLNAVIAKDLCVIVGAQGYTGTEVPNMSSRLGKFDYYPESDGTNLFLLVDHIYAGLQFNMTLDVNYAALRDIKVKNILLKPENAGNDVVEAVDAVVTIAANNTNQSPLSVAFPTDRYKKGKNPEPAVLYDGKAKSLSTDSPTFMACLCPGANTKFTLETTYDVYDRKGNIIREGETVRNAISLDYDLEAGKLHTVNIKVMPTYLYVLSDPDLESPTFVVVN